MISKNKIKLIRSLEQKKFRKEQQLFVAEGHKLVDDLLPAFDCTFLAALKEWLDTRREVVETLARKGCEIQEVSAEELQKASLQKNPQDVLAVFHQRQAEGAPEHILKEQLCLGLDGVQDPGNVGTIIRTADAAGLDGVLLSNQCADVFSPKVLRATMGSIFRMNLRTTDDLPGELTKLREKGYSILSSQLDGTPFYEREKVAEQFALIIGNEGNGVSEQVQQTATHRVRLPMRGGAESLNAAIAAAIMMYELMR